MKNENVENMKDEFPKEKNNQVILIISIVALILIVAVIVYLLVIKSNNKDYQSSEQVSSSKIDISSSSISNEKIYIYKISEHEDAYGSKTRDSRDEEFLINTYNCINDRCEYINSDNDYVLINDGGLLAYQYIEDKTIKINYSVPSEEVEDFIAVDDNIGIIMLNDNKTEYYSVTKNKVTISHNITKENTAQIWYWHNENLITFYNYKNSITVEYRTYTVNGDTFEPGIKNLQRLGNSNYYAYNFGSPDNEKLLFDKEGHALFNNRIVNDTLVLDNGEIVFADLNHYAFLIYDSNYNLVKKSNKYLRIYKLIEENYLLVQDQEKNIKIIDEKENIIIDLFKAYNEDENLDIEVYEIKSQKYLDVYVSIPNENSDINTRIFKKYSYNFNTKELTVSEEYPQRADKPILYLYPKKETKVNVTLRNNNNILTSYPKYKNGWEVTAYPSGELKDAFGKSYYALYWDEKYAYKTDFKEGFYVSDKNAIEFLEERLKLIGLNYKEANEFIMYWLPVLENNKHSLVYFELTEERQKNNELIIHPKPDSLLRVLMHIKKVDQKKTIQPQKIYSFIRKGFTAVEWGGVIY